ncbi:MAG: adenylate/guanylate cyclase domain-containing protein [Leptospirales bacterium]
MNDASILIVEDNKKNIQVLAKALEKEKFNISIAHNGVQALNLINKSKPDLILLDIMMPEMDGFETCKRLKADTATKDIPVIFLTAKDQTSDIVKGFELGAVDYLVKPAHSAELLIRVKTHLDLKRHKELLKKENEKLLKDRNTLLQYFSEDVADALIEKGMQNQLTGEILPVSVLFLDIRRFTTISENLEPNLVANLLNRLFTDIMDIIFANHGSVNKIIGDAILATFGAPTPSTKDAENSIKCAIAIQKMISLFNKALPDYLDSDIEIGVGVASGKVFAGNIGSYRRKEYTVIGDTVNIASRLESMTKEVDASILVDKNTMDLAGPGFIFHEIEIKSVKGKANVVDIYSVTVNNSSDVNETEFF